MNHSGGKKPDPDPDDGLSFRELVGPVTPLKTRGRAHIKKRQPPPRPLFLEADEQAVLDESLAGGPSEPPLSASDEISFRRKGVSMSVLRSLRSGKYAIQEELDLHGMNATQARTALRQFMNELLMSDTRCVRIIHGKGLRSGPRGPVLKGKVVEWLPQWDQVLAFVTAPENNGGTGAVYVLLAR